MRWRQSNRSQTNASSRSICGSQTNASSGSIGRSRRLQCRVVFEGCGLGGVLLVPSSFVAFTADTAAFLAYNLAFNLAANLATNFCRILPCASPRVWAWYRKKYAIFAEVRLVLSPFVGNPCTSYLSVFGLFGL